MERVIAIFLSCVLLSASSLLASSAEETYQAALTQEKGEGNLEEAIRLYQQVIEAHEKGEGDEKHGGPGATTHRGVPGEARGWHRHARRTKPYATSTPTSHRWKRRRHGVWDQPTSARQ